MRTRQDCGPAREVQMGQEVQVLRTGLEGRRKVETGMKPQGPLSPEARLAAVDPQGSQLNLKSGRSALGASSF